jgi:hypothetical protein
MGLFDGFKKARELDTAMSSYSVPPGIIAPYDSHLLSVIFPNIDESAFPVTVADAMTVPAVSRAVQIYSSVSSQFELQASTGSLPWLTETEGAITAALRIAFTVQDLIFFNESLWICAKNDAGFVTDAVHVARDRWSADAKGVVKVDNNSVNQDELIYFRGLLPMGFLEAGRNSVRHALNIARTINNRSAVPEPVTLIKETGSIEADEDEIDALLARMSATLQNNGGGLVHVPKDLDVVGYGASDSNNTMLIQARMAVRTDIANFLGINSAMLDGSTGSNDVYSNALQSKSELLELSIKTFTEPIASRLSQNDVTAPGTKVIFDYSSYEVIEDARGNIGTATPQEVKQ